MKIGIIGTRGIPNNYGGFEQMAQYLSAGLKEKNHEVFVYNSHNHPYSGKNWKGVNIIRCIDPEYKIGTAGQFIYDLNCINDARNRNFDILLHLGYTSDSVWHRRWPKNTINIVNMDGLEWKREKYSRLVKIFLKWAESLAAKNAAVLIADSPGIQQHLSDCYGKSSVYIPYGAMIFKQPNTDMLIEFNLSPNQYFLAIARMEPENNLEMIINGFKASAQQHPLLIVGNAENKYGSYLKKKYSRSNIIFTSAIFDPKIINNLRYFSTIYFHGHSVGGTNPSLLEAMACQCNIAAHNNIFNQNVLADNGDYFSSVNEIAAIINTPVMNPAIKKRKEINLQKIETIYNWSKIITSYEDLMLNSLSDLR